MIIPAWIGTSADAERKNGRSNRLGPIVAGAAPASAEWGP